MARGEAWHQGGHGIDDMVAARNSLQQPLGLPEVGDEDGGAVLSSETKETHMHVQPCKAARYPIFPGRWHVRRATKACFNFDSPTNMSLMMGSTDGAFTCYNYYEQGPPCSRAISLTHLIQSEVNPAVGRGQLK